MNLEQLGWKPFFSEQFHTLSSEGFIPGRVALEHKHIYRVYTGHGELLAEVSGKLRHAAFSREDYPAVGDWVVLQGRLDEGKATIHGILDRSSKFSRKVAGNKIEEQIVAANVDTVFLVNALNQDFNIRRMERYLVMAWESGANPVIILSKADLCDDVEDKVAQVESIGMGVPVHVISSLQNEGVDELACYLGTGQTVALLGSSGAGKSTLTNTLYGREIQKVKEVREGDDRGKHTTTHRELVILPNGGLLIDTPGMRELQLWESQDGLQESFEDIEQLSLQCSFRDCKHVKEPGCAVKGAIQAGTLSSDRFDSFLKLQKELAFLERKTDKQAMLAEREKMKKLTKAVRRR